MARTKGAKEKNKGSRFKSYEGEKPTDQHIRLTKDMMMSKNFLKLSANAFKLYGYMKLWASGQETFKYSISMVLEKTKDKKKKAKLMSATTFEKAKKELIKYGFIEQLNLFSARDKREAGEFMFSNKWHKELKIKENK